MQPSEPEDTTPSDPDRELTPEEQILGIVRVAMTYGAELQGELTPERRDEVKSRIARAYESLQPDLSVRWARAWVREAFVLAAKRIDEGSLTEAQAMGHLRLAIDRVAGLREGPCFGAKCDDQTLGASLLAWQRAVARRGRPEAGAATGGSKWDALVAVLKKLGLADDTLDGEALKKQTSREPGRKRPR